MRSIIAALTAAATAVSGLSTEWTWPVDDPAPHVVRGFDPPDEPWSAGHRGVDLAVEPGSVVRAAGAGTVSHAGMIAGVGVVTVSHGAVRTTYQPVTPRVSVGRPVEVGDVLGVVASAGSHCAPDSCLHWGLIEGSTYLDPLRLISTTAPPRLLPLGDDALRAPSSPPVPDPVSRDAPTDVTGLAAAGALAGLRSLTSGWRSTQADGGRSGVTGSAQARGWACWYALRSRSTEMCV